VYCLGDADIAFQKSFYCLVISIIERKRTKGENGARRRVDRRVRKQEQDGLAKEEEGAAANDAPVRTRSHPFAIALISVVALVPLIDFTGWHTTADSNLLLNLIAHSSFALCCYPYSRSSCICSSTVIRFIITVDRAPSFRYKKPLSLSFRQSNIPSFPVYCLHCGHNVKAFFLFFLRSPLI
jgi:hypothetical protein